MIYYMSTKTLVKEFQKDHSPEEILDCEFISFSHRVVGANHSLEYSDRIFFGLDAYQDDKNIAMVKNHLKDQFDDMVLIINMIENCIIKPDKVFIILSSPKETRTRYPYFYAKSIEELFKYPIIDYKKDKYKDFYYDPTEVLNICSYYIANIKLELMDFNNFKKLSKKKMKSLFKDAGIYEKGMDKDEMIEIFEDHNLPFR